jgi:hypothetical protein
LGAEGQEYPAPADVAVSQQGWSEIKYTAYSFVTPKQQ